MRIAQAALFAGLLFIGVLICLRLGWQLGRTRLRKNGEGALAGLGTLEGSIYALMGLLIAFTFTGAAARFEHRRDLIMQEANAIDTAWQRLDLLEAEARDELRTRFKQYLDVRIEMYANAEDERSAAPALAKSSELQDSIWTRLVQAARADPTPRTATLVLPAANEMFDIATTRLLAIRQHPPIAIYLMLGFLVLVSALLASFGMAKASSQSGLHVICFAAIVSAAIFLIIDMEFPRLGLLRVDSFDRIFVELRRSMD